MNNSKTFTRFEQDSQTVWERETSKGGSIFSGAIMCSEKRLNLSAKGNAFWQTEKILIWVKAQDEESLEEAINFAMDGLKSGQLVAIREFSETPFHAKNARDINPETGEELNRYSRTRLVSKNDAHLHRTWVTPETVEVLATEQVSEEA